MDAAWLMSAAYHEAMKAFDEGEVPIGAIIEMEGKIIGRGYNRMEKLQDATAHAEIIAISAASNTAGSWRLERCTIYVTVEPCLMCLGALVQSRVGAIVYGARDPRAGAVDSFFYRQEIERAYHYFPSVQSGLMATESSQLLTEFFKNVRKKN